VSPDPVAELRAALSGAVDDLGGGSAQQATLERPNRAEQGDYSTNAAMLLAPVLGSAPREIAERLSEALRARLNTQAERVEVAGPGFVNLRMADQWYRAAVDHILAAEDFGSRPEQGERILLEFVSANPTGPLTAAGGRGAAYGDSLARILERCGYGVEREYYLNDAGTQITSFAASIAARMRGEEPAEDGYAGEYVTELAAELKRDGASPSDLDDLARRGSEAMRGRIESTLDRFGVRFDTWFSERALLEGGALEDTLRSLEERAHTYRYQGALWLRTSAYGDDKDRVLVRSNGEPTYFASDIAYHRDKLQRGADLMIDPLGADHHGYVPRMKAAVAMLSDDADRYEAPIMQLVNIVERGERARMSKRKGDFVTLDGLIDDIGTDATRFFLLQRSQDTVIDIDLELARLQSQENPVYYVQYAHARISSILRKASAESHTSEERVHQGEAVPCEPSERALVRRLLEFPEEVRVTAERRAPHRMAAYATSIAADFHAFYRDCRVVGADDESGIKGLEAARLGVCNAARLVIATSLGLLGVGAPDVM
jgi:arginyl-tRNA synthetase